MKCVIGAEKEICDLLEEFIGKSSSLDLVGKYCDSESVRSQLSQGKVIDLFFLDLEIPKLDLLNYIVSLDYQPNVIFISGSDQNAVKAFDLNAVDYLLKPVTYARFFKAVDKALRYHSPKESRNIAEDEIFIKKGTSLVKLRLKELKYIEALENYIVFHTGYEKYTIHFTMKAIENQLPSGDFIRIHRSYIVNLSMIQSVNEDFLVLLVGKELKNIPLGNSFRETLLNRLTRIVR